MIVTFDRRDLPPVPDGGAVVSVGVFDGVHLGHQAILRENLSASKTLAARSTIVTFRNHPKGVLLGRAPRTLTSLDHRLELFRRAGIEHTVALDFDSELRSVLAREFATRFLAEELGARKFVLGFDSKFGHDREGTPEFLRALGMDVTVVPEVVLQGRPVSSTAIREAVELGDLTGAARMLGRPVAVYGHVVPGDALGRELGFPTANLDLHHELRPPVGVYACRVRRHGRMVPAISTEVYPAVANIGTRPTVTDHAAAVPRVEVHLLDFEGDLYGDVLEVEFVAFMREEQRFPSLAALKDQIARDVLRARAHLAKVGTS